MPEKRMKENDLHGKMCEFADWIADFRQRPLGEEHKGFDCRRLSFEL
jgi:hypothetical protein